MPLVHISAPCAARGTAKSMERMLGEFLTPNGGVLSTLSDRVWRPPTDVYETDDMIVVRIEIASMNPQDFHVRLDDGKLIVQGRRDDACRPQKRIFHQMEINYGPFVVVVALPEPIDQASIHATYRNGLLEVMAPKLKSRVTRIPIEGEEDDIDHE